MVISRRELPRTNHASCDRLGRTRILLSRTRDRHTGRLGRDSELPFGGDADCPDKADELARDGRDHMRHRFAPS